MGDRDSKRNVEDQYYEWMAKRSKLTPTDALWKKLQAAHAAGVKAFRPGCSAVHREKPCKFLFPRIQFPQE